jgi:hypothetical protein
MPSSRLNTKNRVSLKIAVLKIVIAILITIVSAADCQASLKTIDFVASRML